MLSKTLLVCAKGNSLLSNALRNAFRKGPRSMSSYADVQAHKRPRDSHMNDIPLPEPFQKIYQKRQVGNNFVLVAGIIFFAFSSSYVINSGVIVPNLTPPRKNPE